MGKIGKIGDISNDIVERNIFFIKEKLDEIIDHENELIDFIQAELDRAREEGRREVIHELKEEIDMAEVSKFIDAHQDFFNSFGKSVLLKISKLNKKK